LDPRTGTPLCIPYSLSNDSEDAQAVSTISNGFVAAAPSLAMQSTN
jgi:hypothetical protein